MSKFQDITVTYNDKNYVIKANEVFGLVAKVESIISIQKLMSGEPPLSLVCEAFAAVLSHCGVEVTGEKLYCDIYGGKSSSDKISSALACIMMIILPPEEKIKSAPKKKPPRKKVVKKA